MGRVGWGREGIISSVGPEDEEAYDEEERLATLPHPTLPGHELDSIPTKQRVVRRRQAETPEGGRGRYSEAVENTFV